MKLPGKTPPTYHWLLLACWFISCLAVAQDARIHAELASPSIALGESVNLQVVVSGTDAELDVSALETDFTVLSRGSSRQVNIYNGVRESTVIWNIELQPRREGQLTIPPVNVGQLVTRPLLLQVTAAPSGSDRQVYVEASVDTVQPYVQSQVIYTLKVFQRVQFSDGSLGYPNAPGVSVQQIEADDQTTENVNGQLYNVLQRRYVLFPQTSGRIVIPPVTLQGAMPGKRSNSTGLFTPRNRFARQSNSIELEVQPRPASFTGQWWLPVSSLELAAQWVTPADEFIVGRPLTRTITLTANGVGEAQLPEITPPDVPAAKIYADASEANTISVANGVQAQRRFSWAIIPQRAGSLTLPSITLPWFDVTSGTMQTATVPAQTIEILAAADSALTGGPVTDVQNQAQVSAQDTTASSSVIENTITSPDSSNASAARIANDDTNFWKRLALITGVGWIATLLAWVFNRLYRKRFQGQLDQVHKPLSRPNIPIQIAAVEAAVKGNDFASLSRSVSAWGAAVYGTASAGPGEIAGQVESTELSRLLWALDAALYSPVQKSDIASFAGLAELLRAETPDVGARQSARSQDEYALPTL